MSGEEVLIGGNVRSNLERGQSQIKSYCNFAYSALACFRMGMSGSASFFVGGNALLLRFLQQNHIGFGVSAQYAKLLPVRRPVE